MSEKAHHPDLHSASLHHINEVAAQDLIPEWHIGENPGGYLVSLYQEWLQDPEIQKDIQTGTGLNTPYQSLVRFVRKSCMGDLAEILREVQREKLRKATGRTEERTEKEIPVESQTQTQAKENISLMATGPVADQFLNGSTPRDLFPDWYLTYLEPYDHRFCRKLQKMFREWCRLDRREPLDLDHPVTRKILLEFLTYLRDWVPETTYYRGRSQLDQMISLSCDPGQQKSWMHRKRKENTEKLDRQMQEIYSENRKNQQRTQQGLAEIARQDHAAWGKIYPAQENEGKDIHQLAKEAGLDPSASIFAFHLRDCLKDRLSATALMQWFVPWVQYNLDCQPGWALKIESMTPQKIREFTVWAHQKMDWQIEKELGQGHEPPPF